MAVYITQPESTEGEPCLIERIEVRPWRLGGKQHQEFVIGSGANFGATSNILVEIIYSVNDVQFFYTRNFIHYYVRGMLPEAELQQEFNAFKSGKRDMFGFADMLPETAVVLKRERHTYQGQEYSHYSLKIKADVGAAVGMAGPGQRMINIELDIDEPDGFQFMQQLLDEIVAVHQGKHPDPASFPASSSHWNFLRQANQKAYDLIAEDYEEKYFAEPLLSGMFDAWLKDIPAGGHILDVGCGHGKSVIERLLRRGYRVTGADLSPKMLERARQNFPAARFINQLASEMMFESEFDGACSFSSLLYLDPIDLAHSLHRLYCALRPNGQLFLYASDLHPGWRGEPFHLDLGQWMWGWTYGMDEAVKALEEHGYFKVLAVEEVTSEAEKQRQVEDWYKEAKEKYERDIKAYPQMKTREPDRSKAPILPYKYVVVARA